VAISQVSLARDTATARTLCHNPMYLPEKDGVQQLMFVGLWYHDTFVRTPEGWRMTSRVQEKGYLHGLSRR
jgi:hypothetical protein